MSRLLVERTPSIDVGELNREGAFSLEPRWFPFMGLTSRRFKIEYRGYRWPAERRSQTIGVTWTRCNFGGRRPWFVCSCGKRAARLFPAAMGLLFCRKCAGVVYESQSWGRKRRCYRKAQWILRRIGVSKFRGDLDIATKRPRGMHQRTYRRLMGTLEALKRELRRGGAYRPRTRRQFSK
jgi:hypothetical protein